MDHSPETRGLLSSPSELVAPSRHSDLGKAIGVSTGKVSEWVRGRLSAEATASYDDKVRHWLMRKREELLLAQQAAEVRRAAAAKLMEEARNSCVGVSTEGAASADGDGMGSSDGAAAVSTAFDSDDAEIVALADYIGQCGGNASMVVGFTMARHVRLSGNMAGAAYTSYVAPPDARGKRKALRSKADVARYLGLVPPKGKAAATAATDAAAAAPSGEAAAGGRVSPAVASMSGSLALAATTAMASTAARTEGTAAGAAGTAGAVTTTGVTAEEEGEMNDFLQEELQFHLGCSGLSQRVVSQRMGVSQSQLSQWLGRTLMPQPAMRVGRKVMAYLAQAEPACSITAAGASAAALGGGPAAPLRPDAGAIGENGGNVSQAAIDRSGTASPMSAAEGSSLTWLQCDKCDKWRRVDEVTAAVFSAGAWPLIAHEALHAHHHCFQLLSTAHAGSPLETLTY